MHKQDFLRMRVGALFGIPARLQPLRLHVFTTLAVEQHLFRHSTRYDAGVDIIALDAFGRLTCLSLYSVPDDSVLGTYTITVCFDT
jgi:hypothetical protein